MKEIIIDPITRLEGHGNVSIFLNDEGEVENAILSGKHGKIFRILSL